MQALGVRSVSPVNRTQAAVCRVQIPGSRPQTAGPVRPQTAHFSLSAPERAALALNLRRLTPDSRPQTIASRPQDSGFLLKGSDLKP